MSFLKIDNEKCIRCGVCENDCPFGALTEDGSGVRVGDQCRLCGVCVRQCPAGAISIEEGAPAEQEAPFDKNEWRDFLVFAEQERGDLHPVAFELLGEARKMAAKIGYRVRCLIIGGAGTAENAEKLLQYGADTVYVYEHEAFSDFRADCFTEAAADCISEVRPSSVLIGATALGRSLAPRLATRFRTGLTADCTTLDILPDSDMVQIRPAFGGNIMAQIAITRSRPQFATVRYRVMDRAERAECPAGSIVRREVTERMTQSKIRIAASEVIRKVKTIEEEDILVAVGRGARGEKEVALCRELAEALGGQLCFTRPMVENGFGDQLHQIGLSGHTVRPKLIITCGVSGAIQFTSCMNQAECIVAVNTDPGAGIFGVAHYCIVDDLCEVVPRLTELVREHRADTL